MRKKILTFLILFFMGFAASSCHQVSSLKELVIQKEEKKTTPKKNLVPPTHVSEAVHGADEPSPPSQPNLVTTAPSVPSLPSPSSAGEVTSPVSIPSAGPVIRFRNHFGGEPTSLSADGKHLYMALGRQLMIFDLDLNFQASFTAQDSILAVVSQPAQDHDLLFISEANQNLEIVSLDSAGLLKEIKSFKAGGGMEIFQSSMAVFLKDNIQFIKVTKEEEPHVTAEIPISGAVQAVMNGPFLYVAANNSLHIVDLNTNEVHATIAVGAPFQILGVHPADNQSGDLLLLALKSPSQERWSGIQALSLVSGGGGVAGPGTRIDLVIPADKIQQDEGFPFLSLFRGGKVSFFDLSTRREWIPEQTFLDAVFFLKVIGKNMVTAGKGVLQKVDYQILTQGSLGKNDLAAPPLAVPTTGPLLAWGHPKTFSFPFDCRSLVLLDDNRALLTALGFPSLYFSANFSTQPGNFSPLSFGSKEALDLVPVRLTGKGILMEEKEGGRLFWVKGDFSGMREIQHSDQSSLGRDLFFDGKSYFLYQVIKDSSGDGGALLTISRFDPDKGVLSQTLASLPLSRGGGIKVFAKGTQAVIAALDAGTVFVSMDLSHNKISLSSLLAPTQAGNKAIDVLVSPNEKTAYVYGQASDGKSFIDLISIKGDVFKKVSSITTESPVTTAQFKGGSFSLGGNRFLLPRSDGLAVYDVKSLSQPQLQYLWPRGEVLWADVAHRGKLVCAALGEQGIDCGSF